MNDNPQIYCTYCGYLMGEDHLICTCCKGKTFPKTYVGQLIADKWYLSMQELSRRTGTHINTIKGILKGDDYGVITQRRLVGFLENYKGEYEE